MSYFKPVPGDVFEFMMEGKYYYFQYLLRLLPFYNERLIRYFKEGFVSPPDLNELLKSKETGCRFCDFISRQWAKEIKFLGNYPVPQRLHDPPEYLLGFAHGYNILTDPVKWTLWTRDSDYKHGIDLGYYLPEKYKDIPTTFMGSFLTLKRNIAEGMVRDGILKRWPVERIKEWERLKALSPDKSEAVLKVHANHTSVNKKKDNLFVPFKYSMKELRCNLSAIIGKMRGYVAFSINKEIARKEVRSLKAILTAYLSGISGRKNDKKNLLASLKKAVLQINKLNKQCDNELIETEERDDIGEFLIKSGSYAGYDITDQLDMWRDW